MTLIQVTITTELQLVARVGLKPEIANSKPSVLIGRLRYCPEPSLLEMKLFVVVFPAQEGVPSRGKRPSG